MGASNTKLSIISRAASATGNGALVSLDDGGPVAQLVREHYDGLVEAMLTQHAWKFARRTAALTALDQEPERPWLGLYARPSDCLALHYVQDECALRVEHEERDTESTAAIAVMSCPTSGRTLTAVYTARVQESRWPGDFALAVQTRMEAVFLRGLGEQRTEADRREKVAIEVFEARARVRDQRSSTSTDASEWDLTRARRRGSTWVTSRA